MKLPQKIAGALLSLFLVSANGSPSTDTVLEIDFPVFPEDYDIEANEIVSDLVVQENGQLVWNGEPFGQNQLLERLKTVPCPNVTVQPNDLSPDGSPQPQSSENARIPSLQLNPSANARFDQIWLVLETIRNSHVCTLKFANLAVLGSFELGSNALLLQSDFEKRTIASLPNAFGVHVTTTDAYGREPGDSEFSGPSVNGACRVYMDSAPVTSEGLTARGQDVFKKFMESYGGTEKFAEANLSIDLLPGPIIFSAANTPWKCVGAAAHSLQSSGYMRMKFAPALPKR
jgi:hypothetical protein